MNLYPYFFRAPIRSEFSQEEYDRFFYFERQYHTISAVRPNTKPFINFENTLSPRPETIAITYRDDGMIGLNWVQVTYLQPDHPEAKQAFDTVVQRLKENVPTYTLTEMHQLYRDTPADEDGQRLFAVYATAVGAPWAYDAAYFAAMQEYAKDSKATVRAGVVVSIGYIGQTEYVPLLEQLAQDNSEDVRGRAQDMLESFESLSKQLQTVR